jgi:radical SAM protein with 4Fe4S-binding SPASM domain
MSKHSSIPRHDPYQRIMKKTHEQRIPFSAHFELTYRCNLSCIHCYATDRKRQGELATREVEHILDQLAGAGCLFLCFTGGEIFCRTDLIQLLRAAKARGFALRLLTNGSLLTAQLADQLAEIVPLSIDISLYAMSPAIHDRITGVKGSHARTMAAIRLCRERGLNTAVKSVLLKYNLAEHRALSVFAQATGARFVFDYLLAPADNGVRIMNQHGLSENEIYEFVLGLGAQKASRATPGAMPKHGGRPTAMQPKPSDPICGEGCNTVAITPFGDVLPCLAIRQSVGNLRERKFQEIWTGPALDKIRNARYAMLKECQGCNLIQHCTRCSGIALAECGNIMGRSESACMAARAIKLAADLSRVVDRTRKQPLAGKER